jgi:hypothetical protein
MNSYDDEHDDREASDGSPREDNQAHPPERPTRRGGRPPKDTVEVVVVAAPEPSNAIIDELQTLGPKELGALLGRTQKSIKVDSFRRPDTLPPRFVIPGTRKLLWRVKDVRDWMDALAAQQAELRSRAMELASQTGLKPADMMRALRPQRPPKRRT